MSSDAFRTRSGSIRPPASTTRSACERSLSSPAASECSGCPWTWSAWTRPWSPRCARASRDPGGAAADLDRLGVAHALGSRRLRGLRLLGLRRRRPRVVAGAQGHRRRHGEAPRARRTRRRAPARLSWGKTHGDGRRHEPARPAARSGAGRPQGDGRRRSSGRSRVELRDPRHGARPRQLPALRRSHGGGLRAARDARRVCRCSSSTARRATSARTDRGWPGVESAGAALASAALAAWRALPAGRDAASERRRRATSSLPDPALSVRNCSWTLDAAGACGSGLGGRCLPRSRTHGGAHRRDRVGDGAGRAPDAARPRHQDGGAAGASTKTFVAGYSNDYLGYFLTRDGLRRARATSPAAASTARGAGRSCGTPPWSCSAGWRGRGPAADGHG